MEGVQCCLFMEHIPQRYAGTRFIYQEITRDTPLMRSSKTNIPILPCSWLVQSVVWDFRRTLIHRTPEPFNSASALLGYFWTLTRIRSQTQGYQVTHCALYTPCRSGFRFHSH